MVGKKMKNFNLDTVHLVKIDNFHLMQTQFRNFIEYATSLSQRYWKHEYSTSLSLTMQLNIDFGSSSFLGQHNTPLVIMTSAIRLIIE